MKFFSLLFFTLLFTIYLKSQNKTIETNSFSLDYPKNDWSAERLSDKIISISSITENINDVFKENISIIDLTEQAKSFSSNKDYFESILGKDRLIIKNYYVIEELHHIKNKYYQTLVTFNNFIQSGKELKMKVLLRFYEENNKVFQISYTTEENQFEKYKSDADLIFNSFILK